MRVLRVISLLPIAGALNSRDEAHNAKRIAIIGAGAGGSSAAYHLAQYATEASIPTNITVFERNSYVGGRTTTVNAWDDPNTSVELGGSIFVEVNHIMVEAAKRFNLSAAEHNVATRLQIPDLGIWNGKEFVIITRADEDTWWDKAKLLWRYGTAPLWTNRLMKSAVGKFLSIYDEPIFPWKSLSDVVEQVGLLEVTGVTGEQYLKANGIGEAFAKEIIQASTRVNYASNLPYIHGLETMVCMATNGAMQIKGGNWQIFANMLDSSGATVHLNTTVARISKQEDGTYVTSTSTGHTATYDEVILAAPLQYSDLVIDPAPEHVPDEIPYTKLFVTLFASPFRLDPKAFNLGADKPVPQYVLTTLPDNEEPQDNVGSPGFFSISILDQGINPHSSTPRPEYIYKIFNHERVTPKILTYILGHDVSDDEAEHGDVNGAVSWIYHKVWYSYPKEYPRVTFEEIKLDEGLWYTSGIESFISTMETSALSGKNVARLIRDEWVAKKADGELGGKSEKAEEVFQEEL
ncbi:prenylcysteine oxidase-like protein 1 precursor [Cucurbitaria berberidis CBS 394.84]|uniref:Prenylcysteine oxidase-like protein 1 n=1 Tax=Cucurbitaria berberidis CBS 394.84 TaxID=1168544 RepID=A0A9P4GDL2_9PLEO|nr:prenylcysteine oxidase-like protein 1 precursor [Cucurbitaria berberidis CBS 394.84]KAF1843973.1 prenylcysteine oxidase-like protein 1 precursor [Cucurbitaria berberidis CBS 394.84]